MSAKPDLVPLRTSRSSSLGFSDDQEPRGCISRDLRASASTPSLKQSFLDTFVRKNVKYIFLQQTICLLKSCCEHLSNSIFHKSKEPCGPEDILSCLLEFSLVLQVFLERLRPLVFHHADFKCLIVDFFF